ncbi:MAG: hypothetical protein LBF75_04160 [Treponema sp.]|nr:hypothetical protein [Treponema sp.]
MLHVETASPITSDELEAGMGRGPQGLIHEGASWYRRYTAAYGAYTGNVSGYTGEGLP